MMPRREKGLSQYLLKKEFLKQSLEGDEDVSVYRMGKLTLKGGQNNLPTVTHEKHSWDLNPTWFDPIHTNVKL